MQPTAARRPAPRADAQRLSRHGLAPSRALALESLIHAERDRLATRLTRALGGDRHGAEDICQEAFARCWQRLPRDLDRERQRAWLRRTAENMAIDELRRRARRPIATLDETAHETFRAAAEPDAARGALAALDAHERFVLLLRFEAGFTHAEIGRVLDVSEEAARKRVARARMVFLAAYRAARSEATPLVLLVAHSEPPAAYVRWLEDAGARVRQAPEALSERDVALADAVVLTGVAARDLHSRLYGEAPRLLNGAVDLAADRADLAVVNAALALDLPIVGICRGHQLLNLASGGSLFQDVVLDGATGERHDTGEHRLRTHGDTLIRGVAGHAANVQSNHHQAIRRLGRHLRVAASSPDELVEVIERTDRRFAIGLQWHPETTRGEHGDRVAQALVAAATGRAA